MPREHRSKEPDHPGMATIIENDNAATGGHPDEPVPECPNSRSALADTRRAALKATGAMSLSKKIDSGTKVAAVRANGKAAPRGDAARAVVTGAREGVEPAPDRVRKSNAEIADGVTTTARKSPAPRAARTTASTGGSGPRGPVASDARPVRRPARAGHAGHGSRSKGADQGLAE